MFKRLWHKFGPNPLDLLLKRAQRQNKRRFLIGWNRGLGDIPLGLYALISRIHTFIPDAEITFLTRKDLIPGFELMGGVRTIVANGWKRGEKNDFYETLSKLGVNAEEFDVLIEAPDPTRWLKWQHGKVTPKLHWKAEWDELWKKFPLHDEGPYIGMHIQTETNYATWRNWPFSSWEQLATQIAEKGGKTLLFGFHQSPQFSAPEAIDLRGKTSLFELLSIIKNRCSGVVLPDSGVLAMTYYLTEAFPIRVVSLWADPYMGILKQNVASPNPNLVHTPLLGAGKDIQNISVDQVLQGLFPHVS